jgi:hypothetical protein
MASGDNIMTSIYVARKLKMISKRATVYIGEVQLD